ncbi:MAG TPA: type II and III secretion system family protein [Alphaproteobacteria bacterium]|nr:type II and III secretion system family protein [Alphaproteobacteria bacterium]
MTDGKTNKVSMKRFCSRSSMLLVLGAVSLVFLGSCADVNTPGARNANIPSPAMADPRPEAINEQPDSVIYLPLGSDVLVPEVIRGAALPDEVVGPFELRSETLAGALQLILADYQIPLAFETDEGLTRTITVANLRGPLSNVVDKVCGLADLYCSFEDGLLVIKDMQTFTVSIPPIGGNTDMLSSLATGLQAITGKTPITETATRTIIYEATSRTAQQAERYFQRIRSNTALIVFEVYIWEVGLNSDNATGIDWQKIDVFGKYATGINIPGGVGAGFTPISIGLPTVTGTPSFDGNDVLEFISNYGSVKTISQPQITVLSGSEATLRAADTVNYVSSLSRSVDNGEVTVSTETDSVDTGFTLTISSAWDKATIYGNIDIELQEFRRFQNFDADGTTLQLPETTERELSTQIRIRPGDSLLIAGLVRENDQYDTAGPGFNKPLFPTSRSATVSNTELVFLLKPRVIVYTSEGKAENYAQKTIVQQGNGVFGQDSVSSEQLPQPIIFPTSTIPADLLNPSGH